MINNIPTELKVLPQWVCYKNKVPFNPVSGYPAKAGIPETWTTYEEAEKNIDKYDGLGFEFNNNGIVGIDLDDVIDESGLITEEAKNIVEMLNSYTEISPSGRGFHIFIKGDIPDDGRKRGFIEIYKAGRYFTMTGNVYGEIKPINERIEEIAALWGKYFEDKAEPIFECSEDRETALKYLKIGLSKDKVLKELWDGTYQSEKCKSQSEIDLALMGKLLYWCSGDVYTAIEQFLNSPYAVQKDDEHREKLERSDYLERTARSAMKTLKSTALLDDENFKLRFGKGTKAVQELFQRIRPNVNYSFDDKGNGELFADIYADIARFNITANEWFIYTGKVWIRDIAGMRVSRLAKQMRDEMLIFSNTIKDDKKKEEYQKHVGKLGSRASRENLIRDARDKYCITNADLDKDTNLLNVLNGTLDLKTFEFREHRAEDLLNKIANVNYEPGAKCDLWERFIHDVMTGDMGKTEYLQKALGYGITANNSLETCFVLYGATTRNGKSTLVETIMHMLGGSAGYSMQMKPESLALKQNNDSRQANGDIARLSGARFLNVSEPQKKMIFDAALLKTLLGRDSIVARHLHEREFEFIPMFKLFMNTNFLPIINDDTLFSSGRINVISFEKHFEENQRDPELKDKLRTAESLSGILNWCIDGLKKFYKDGLKPTNSIIEATAEYRQESDKVGKFIAECLETANENITAGTAYHVYENWCRSCGYGCENQSNFFAELRGKNLISKSGTVNGKTKLRVIKGYKVAAEWAYAVPLV